MQNNKMEIVVTMLLKSTLAHFGEEKLSTTSLCRRQEFVIAGKKTPIPVYSGNALRGICRRLLMKDFFELAEIKSIGVKFYHTLFTGGALKSGVSLSTMAEKTQLVTLIPPLSLFGAAIGDTILQGKMQFGICYPICKELNEYNKQQSDISYREFITDTFHVRKDDTKSEVLSLSDEERDENPTQMKYDFEGLAAGTQLETHIVIENANEIEIACMGRVMNLLREKSKIGGKNSIGYGNIEVDYKPFDDVPYVNFIKDNAEAIRAYVAELSEKLK